MNFFFYLKHIYSECKFRIVFRYFFWKYTTSSRVGYVIKSSNSNLYLSRRRKVEHVDISHAAVFPSDLNARIWALRFISGNYIVLKKHK